LPRLDLGVLRLFDSTGPPQCMGPTFCPYILKSSFERPFVRLALCYRTFVCLSVTLVYCGQTVGWIKMPLGTEAGLSQGHVILDRHPATPTETGTAAPPHFSAHVYCGQTVAISATAELLFWFFWTFSVHYCHRYIRRKESGKWIRKEVRARVPAPHFYQVTAFVNQALCTVNITSSESAYHGEGWKEIPAFGRNC